MKCTHCRSRRPKIGETRCEVCKTKSREHTANRRKYRRLNNLCLRCGKNPPGSQRYCVECNALYKAYRNKIKLQAVEHYGTVCQCCNEPNLLFLTIDHINGGGNQHRKKIQTHTGNSFYRWLRQNGYPPGYQVLCFNCNCAKGLYGQCPHETARALATTNYLTEITENQ